MAVIYILNTFLPFFENVGCHTACHSRTLCLHACTPDGSPKRCDHQRCCSVKDNGVQAIENLMKKQGKFDYVLLETTGLADPAPIASIFWMDDALCSSLKLDGIIAMVDAKYVYI